MSLTAKDVAEILQALEASSFDALELELNGVKMSLRRSGAPALAQGNEGAAAGTATPHPATTSRATSPPAPMAPHAPTAAGQGAAPIDAPPGSTAVPAPLLGVFYRAPRPGEPPFIEVGSHVEPDTTVGIIEVMKLMNTVRAGVRGEVVAIAARNGELVEYGEALLFVRAD